MKQPSKYRAMDINRLEKAMEACSEIMKRGYSSEALLLAKQVKIVISQLLHEGERFETYTTTWDEIKYI